MRLIGMTLGVVTVVTTVIAGTTAFASTVPSSEGSVVQLQKELATLGYLPLTGSFQWKYQEPSSLKALWKKGSYNVMTKGAVMEFQAANHLVVDGIAGPMTRAALHAAYQEKRLNPYGYTYVLVSEKSPETLQLWHNGNLELTSLANTGIPQSPTVLGTYPVYERYYSQTMQGTYPNGTQYSDPGVPYVNYFYGGDAVHGFYRHSYGFPQSLGCVELPVSNAKIAWSYIQYGTLVTVQTGGAAPSPFTKSTSYAGYPIVYMGIHNNSYVKKLQELLGITADGNFGSATLAAVKQFQRKHGLVADGIVGPATWQKLLL